MIRHICFFTGNYPTTKDPIFSFVRELICIIADMGVQCTVISPQSLIGKIRKNEHSRPIHWFDKTSKGQLIEIYQPVYLSISKLNKVLNGYNEKARKFVVKRTFSKICHKNKNLPIDVLYAHFWNEGMIIAELSKMYGIKAFVASGESTIVLKDVLVENYKANYKDSISGCIAVSQKNKQETINWGLLDEEKIKVIPNAINPDDFFVEDKTNSRKKLGFPADAFIVVYCGYFIDRKGVKRLSEALEQIRDVYSIFIGSGPIQPTRKNNLFTGKLPHKSLVHYFNSADVFILPTLREGCCNSILEAMACGLPIISSNRSFNDDILNDSYSIRIDPESVIDIRDAIIRLKKHSELKDEMSKNAEKASKQFHLEKRAKTIIEFISDKDR